MSIDRESSEYKERQRIIRAKYNNSEKARARRILRDKRPEHLARRREANRTPERRDKMREYNAKPQTVAKRKAYMKTLKGRLAATRLGARARGIEFTLDISNMPEIPSHCPILGIPLDRSCRHQIPSLDRIDNTMGYVPGNIRWISNKWNYMKNNHTYETALLLLKDLSQTVAGLGSYPSHEK